MTRRRIDAGDHASPPARILRWVPRAHVLGLVLVLATGCAGAAARPSTASPRAPTGRDVVVLLVVDQLAAWVAEERLPSFPSNGGFARLVREGGGMRVLEHGHVVTDTGPGHAALMTGAPPRENGIVANELVLDDGTRASFLRDESTRLVGPEGPTATVGSSLATLRVSTVADRLRARRSDATIVSLSLKDRAALFGGGRRPTATLYFDTGLDAFVTSSAFADALPAWARPLAGSGANAARRSAPWEPLDLLFLRANARTRDDAPGEGDLHGFGTTFPHDFGSSRRPSHAFRASPRSDAALVDLAVAALEADGGGDAPFLLVVSFSANDYVGHVFGPESWESWDTQRRLDEELARLFAALDARFGNDGWSALLSADHGVSSLPEGPSPDSSRCGVADRYERPCDPTVRIDPDVLATHLEAVARAELGDGPWIAGVADPYVHFTARGRSAAFRTRLQAVAARALASMPGVRAVHAMPAAERCASRPDDVFCASVNDAFGDAFVELAGGAFFDSTYVSGFGSGHGSPAPNDRLVPLLGRFSASARASGLSLPARGGEVVGYRTFAALADRLLGGDGTLVE